MIVRGFRQVGWVAAVGGAALGCYMISLNVASERAELVALERQIVDTKRDIRALETELGTRGRLSQLEHWNAEILALSAPSAQQYLDSELKLARFDRRQAPIEERAKVRLASAETTVVQPQAKVAVAVAAPTAEAAEPAPAPVIRAAMVEPPALKPAPVKKAALLQGDLLSDIDAAARAEQRGGGVAGR